MYCARDMALETQYGGLGQWDCTIMVNALQCSNTRNYRVVTMNKMAVVIQREKSTADFQAVLLFASILKPIRSDSLLLEEY